MRPSDSEITPQALNDLGHLASGIGHHVINAFSAIVSNAELLRIKLGPDTPPIDPATIADTVIDTAIEAASVARRLIDYTRPITNIGDDRFHFHQLIAEYVEARRASENEGISWSAQLESVPPVRGNAKQIEVMIDLLVMNAREAMTDANVREITLSTSLDSRGWVMLEIRDTGHGMESKVLERAVEPFFSTRRGHVGVGLSIANGIWRRHRGTLSLRSRAGEGTVLRLCVEPTES